MSKTIVVDMEKLKSVAGKIDTQVQEYQRVYNQIFSEVDGMAAAWKGADNVAFTTQIQGFKDDFEQMTKTLQNFSEFLKSSANKYEGTQNDIIAQAKKLAN